jgi:hypothetical protein
MKLPSKHQLKDRENPAEDNLLLECTVFQQSKLARCVVRLAELCFGDTLSLAFWVLEPPTVFKKKSKIEIRVRNNRRVAKRFSGEGMNFKMHLTVFPKQLRIGEDLN